MFQNIAVAIITPTHTKKSFDIGLELAKKFDSNLTVIECVYKIQQVANSTLRSFYAVDPVASSYEISKFASYYKDQHISQEEVEKAMDWERRNSFSKFGEIFRTHPLTCKRIEKLYQQERELNPQSS